MTRYVVYYEKLSGCLEQDMYIAGIAPRVSFTGELKHALLFTNRLAARAALKDHGLCSNAHARGKIVPVAAPAAPVSETRRRHLATMLRSAAHDVDTGRLSDEHVATLLHVFETIHTERPA